jgi:hypothetical protein
MNNYLILIEITPRVGGNGERAGAGAARTVARHGDQVGVAAERADVLLDPERPFLNYSIFLVFSSIYLLFFVNLALKMKKKQNHRRAWVWSQRPKLPLKSASPPAANPENKWRP